MNSMYLTNCHITSNDDTFNVFQRGAARNLRRRHLPPEIGADVVDEFAAAVDDFSRHDLVARSVVENWDRDAPNPLPRHAPIKFHLVP